ncbi:MAG: hypothetical protein JWP08_3582 [Bryobacterales bacterium]|nr:hypothetical protein [Bryobacterales bacterium]
MYKRAGAACFILAGLASASQAAAILETFTGVATEVWSDGSCGIFDVAGNNPKIGGNLTFNPDDFTPIPTAPWGSAYLTAYTGGPDSVQMKLSDSGGSATVDATSALLLLCSECRDSWSLLLSFDHLSFSLHLNSPTPIVFAPGASVFDLGYPLDSGSTLSGLLSDTSQSLSFTVTQASISPEPSTFGSLLVASGIGWLCWRLRNPAAGAGA